MSSYFPGALIAEHSAYGLGYPLVTVAQLSHGQERAAGRMFVFIFIFFLRPHISSGLGPQTARISITFLMPQLPIPLPIASYTPYISITIVQPRWLQEDAQFWVLGLPWTCYSAFPHRGHYSAGGRQQKVFDRLGRFLPLLMRPWEP